MEWEKIFAKPLSEMAFDGVQGRQSHNTPLIRAEENQVSTDWRSTFYLPLNYLEEFKLGIFPEINFI